MIGLIITLKNILIHKPQDIYIYIFFLYLVGLYKFFFLAASVDLVIVQLFYKLLFPASMDREFPQEFPEFPIFFFFFLIELKFQ